MWWHGIGGKNWGDALNPILIKKLSGKEVISHESILDFKHYDRYAVIGSILGFYAIDNLVIWGSGFISANSRLKNKPKKICAVRRLLTRNIILEQGVDCPEIYGDPALLYPLFYQSSKEQKYKLGIIPHYKDRNNPIVHRISQNIDKMYIIDITGGINKFVDDILACEKVASSSLHGIIAADAYGIPALWVKFSESEVVDEFKFNDYFLSVGRGDKKPLFIREDSTLEEIINCFYKYRVKIDLIKLLDACPFIDEARKNKLIKKLENCSIVRK